MSDRILKVNELLKQVVADIINHEVESKGLLTVKAVETTPDMKHADIWISVLGEDEVAALAVVEEKKRQIQRIVNTKMASKNVPAIHFKVDKSGEYAQKIDELLKMTKA